MKRTVFFTDPHIGLNRVAHTTAKSRILLRDRLYSATMYIIDSINELNQGEPTSFKCLGDLYDEFSNPEDIIKQGADVAVQCDLVLGGNHDMTNRVDVRGSLELISDLNIHRGVVLADNRQEPYAAAIVDHDQRTIYVCVPHAMSQELFEKSLVKASHLASAPEHASWGKILLLHCNVGEPHDHEVRAGQTSLWLTDEYAQEVLKYFDYVLVGHEHVPRSLYDGRLLVLGNVYPFSFGEMADRYCYVYYPDTKKINAIETISVKNEFITISADEMMGAEGKIEVDQYMVQIDGKIKSQDYPAMSRAIANFWKTNDHLYAVRPNYEIDSGAKAKVDREVFVPRTLKETVSESVKSTPFEKEFTSIVAELDADQGADGD